MKTIVIRLWKNIFKFYSWSPWNRVLDTAFLCSVKTLQCTERLEHSLIQYFKDRKQSKMVVLFMLVKEEFKQYEI